MRRPVIDYRELRPNNLNTPRFSHLKLLLGWVGYFIMYILTENLIPVEKCHVVHWWLDDIIPFCEFFVIPYVLWYGLVVYTLGYFLLYDVDSFKKLQTYIIITQVLAMLVYIFYPNCQNLRPAVMPRDNIFTGLVGFLYSVDTNTGVFPSLHCAYSIGIASVWARAKSTSALSKVLVAVFAFVICLSTMFIKQHSSLDFVGAVAICTLAGALVYGVFYREKN